MQTKTEPSFLERSGAGDKAERQLSLLVVLVWLLNTAPRAVQLVVHGRPASLAVVANIAASATLSRALEVVLFAAVLGCAFLAIITSPDGRTRSSLNLVLFLAPWATLLLTSVLSNGSPNRAAILYPLIGFAFWRGSPREVPMLRTVGRITAVTAITSLVMFIAIPSVAILPASLANDSKALLGNQLLAGFFGHPNSLGDALVLGVPALKYLATRRGRAVAHLGTVTAIVLTGDRTALFALLLIWAVRFVIYRSSRYPWDAPLLRWTLPLVGFASIAAALGLPFLTGDPHAFSNRGQIWLGSRQIWHMHPWRGNGLDVYAQISKLHNDLISLAYNAHNQLLHLLVVGGLLGAFGYIALLGWVATSAFREVMTRPWAPSFLISWVVVGGLAVTTDFLDIGDNDYVVWIPLAVLAFGRRRTGVGSTPPTGDLEGGAPFSPRRRW